MTIDDFICALAGVPRYARPAYIKTSDMLLRCWRYCRTDPGFRKEIYDKHGIEDRVLQRFDAANNGEDRLIVADAYSYFESVYRAVIIPTIGAENRAEKRIGLTRKLTAGKNAVLRKQAEKSALKEQNESSDTPE
ncbi:MAG: hypothetical protein E6Q97_08995 [Desulfurellales bacterium]|nr:MAG: hypothetical protein E6Q97_08995 [Desulfurellales bacterium]